MLLTCLPGKSTCQSIRRQHSWYFPRFCCSGILRPACFGLCLTAGLFILSAVLVLSACPRSHRWLATILVSVILATSGILLVVGQPATFAISLIIISSYFFLRVRFLPLCAFLFMLSIAVKPQLGGLIVLYFLGQKIYRRYAAFALAGALALLLSAGLTLRMHPHSANWTSTLQANLSSTLSPGGSADPRPANQEAIGDMNLQSLTSIFFAEAGTFNHVAYLIFLVLLAVLIMVVPWSRASGETHVLALGRLIDPHADACLSPLLRHPPAAVDCAGRHSHF